MTLLIAASVLPTLLGFIGVAVGAILSYLAAVKRLSGKIKTSEASDLWKESQSIRDWSTAQISKLEKRVAVLEQGNVALYEENKRLGNQVQELNETINDLREKIRELAEELRLKAIRVTELEEDRE